MVTPWVSPIVTVVNMFMEHFEHNILNNFNNWFRYVDDTWVKIKKYQASAFFEQIIK